MSRTHDRQHPSEAPLNFINGHAPDILELPEPGTEWEMSEVDLDADVWRSFKHKGVIRAVRNRNSNRTHVWETDRATYEKAQEIVSDRDGLPCCGATGITNDDGVIRCKRCGQAHPRDTVKEVLR